MQPLGNLFPQPVREQVAESKLKIGSVLKFEVSFQNGVRKPKIQIIVGFNNERTVLASVFINSEVNPNVFHSQYLKDLHLKLDTDGRNYLNHESFVDCSNLIEYGTIETKTLLLNNPNVHIGDLSDEDLRLVNEKIIGATTISKKQKKEFGFIK